ncbi:4-hydroxyphenylalkanoate adenylyltransferase [Dyadobacter sp. CECT 9623]|uniref:4-hydroxyphenylalkanoate adenylyltransferase n=1 Tax=Dyadobacter linearis TaxID=2823330 RepID=A0ABM8UWC0_9BACT|nr:fatty acyl-AMP ligase [Dyadobacter sp. CECT 9623]CAG5073155.1 4-hydroxyphenylalkanoate adenylyltransferase [Dyadobacter sp. CECT 9623]
MHILNILESNSNLYPDKLAYGFLGKDGELTEQILYSKLSQQVNAISAGLSTRYKPGARLLILLPAEAAFIRFFLASLQAKLIAVPCPVGYSESGIQRILNIIRDCAASAIITNRKTFRMLFQRQNDAVKALQDYTINWLFTDEVSFDPTPAGNYIPDIDPHQTAYLQYTSGSTSLPKGVMISHTNLVANLSAIDNCFGRTAADVSVTWLPHYHDMGLVDGLLSPLYTGGTGIVLSPLLFITKPFLFLQAISNYQAGFCGGPGFGLDHCDARISGEQLATLDLSSLRVLYVGAEPIRISSLERFAETMKVTGFRRNSLVPAYGLAEATLAVSLHLNGTPMVYHKTADNSKEVVACGPPVELTEVVIVASEEKNALPSSQIGEIWVKNAGVALGYWKNPEATEATFHAYTSDGAGPYLRTGDLGFMENGQLYITGRTKELIIIRGVNYYPQDIEEVVSECHTNVQPNAAAAFSVNTELGESLVIVTEVKRIVQPGEDMDQIKNTVAHSVGLAFGLIPYKILLIPTGKLPRTSSGKIQRLHAKEIFGSFDQNLELLS